MPPTPADAPTVAAIDCGTNSTRLLVSRLGQDGAGRWSAVEMLDRQNTITRLGKGVDATGKLDPEAIDRTLAVLRTYQTSIEAHGATQVRITATSAARDAANRDELFDAAEEILGVRPELLSGDEEGQLTFTGATAELDAGDGPFLVVDIGGGSTELTVGTSALDAVRSLDVGCVRLTEKHLHSDPPAAEELSNAIGEATELFADALREVPAYADARTLVGVAGTITTVAAVELGLAEYDRDAIHHLHLSRAQVEDVFRTLATEKASDRAHNPGLEPARVDVIVGGCCVLVALLRTLAFDEMLVSEADILDGLVQSLADQLSR
jgi:exopolyphosphatase/guanosine-5'-triphosphate,3'-diphosphate pyrophosphatase